MTALMLWMRLPLASSLGASMLGLAVIACAAPGPVAPAPSSPPGALGAHTVEPSATFTEPGATEPPAPPPEPPAPEAPAPGAVAPDAPASDAPIPVAARPPVPHRAGPCPSPSANVTNLYHRAAALAESTGAIEPHRAITEAIRLRLDELYAAGCRPSLDDDKLRAELERLGENLPNAPALFAHTHDPYTTMAGHATAEGGAVALYTWSGDKVRTRIEVTNEGTEMEQRLLLLDANVFQPPGAPEPLLVIANTHPWMASCWRTLRFRVLAPSGDPKKPKTVVDHPGDGRWCEGVDIHAQGSELSFQYLDWGGALTFGQVMRPTVLAFHFGGGAATERFGFPPNPEHLVEDWLERPWSLAREATTDTSRDRLEALHADLGPKVAKVKETLSQTDTEGLSYELFPGGAPSKRKLVIYCALSSTGGPCPHWPKPVDFALEQDGARWKVGDVKPRK
jgi:hypothetical protein